MKIPAIKKLFVEDFPAENRPLISKLATILNPFLDTISKALTNNITAAENMKSKSWSLSLDAAVTTKTVLWPLNEQPTSVQIDRLNKKDGTAPGAAFSMSWAYGTSNGANQVTLTFQGLDSSTAYTTRVTGVV